MDPTKSSQTESTPEDVKTIYSRNMHIEQVVAGHNIFSYTIGMYSASKYAVTAITEALRKQLMASKSKIRVTSISPGAVRSEAAETVSIPGLSIEDIPMLLPSDIADAVVFALSLRQQVHIPELTIVQDGEMDYSPLEKMFGRAD